MADEPSSDRRHRRMTTEERVKDVGWIFGLIGSFSLAFVLGRSTAPPCAVGGGMSEQQTELAIRRAHTTSNTWQRWARRGFPEQPEVWPGFGHEHQSVLQQPTRVA